MSRHTERLIAGLQLFMENYMKKIHDICTEKFNFWNRSAAYTGALKCIAVFNQTVQRQDLAKVCATIPEFPEVFMMVYKNYVWQKDGIDINMFMGPEDVSSQCTYFVNSFLTQVAEKLQQREQAISILELLGEADRKALAEHAVTTALEKTSTHFFRERQRRYVEPELKTIEPDFLDATQPAENFSKKKDKTGRGESESGRAEPRGESETGRAAKRAEPRAEIETGRAKPRGESETGRAKPRGESETGRAEPRGESETGRAKPRGESETGRAINRAEPGGESETGRAKARGESKTGRAEARGESKTGRAEARGESETGSTGKHAKPRDESETGREKKINLGKEDGLVVKQSSGDAKSTAGMSEGAGVGVVKKNTVEPTTGPEVISTGNTEADKEEDSKKVEDDDILTSNDSISVFGTSKEPTKFELALKERTPVVNQGRQPISRELLEKLQESLVKGSRKILASDIDDSRTVVTDVYSQV